MQRVCDWLWIYCADRRNCVPNLVTHLYKLKKGHNLYELFRIINRVISEIQPINVKLGRLTFVDNGLGVILVGECYDKHSIRYRKKLLEDLNKDLPKCFNISARGMDSNISDFHKLHCTLCYLKRPIPMNYRSFVKQVKDLQFSPIIFNLEDVDLVHHRYRSLNYPLEGIINFSLGKKSNLSEKEFIRNLNLV